LAEDTKKIIPKGLLKGFSTFHERIVEIFYSFYDHTYCLKCRHPNPVTVCPYCYMTEMLSFLSKKKPIMAKRFFRLIPSYGDPYNGTDAKTITELKNKKAAYGMCDDCGECSESLETTDKGWVCEDCRG